MSIRYTLAALLLLAAPASAAKVKVGKPAPAWSAVTMDNEEMSLEATRGKVVVINLWATWCAPCKAEMPMMDAFYRRHAGDGLVLLGVQTKDSVPNYKLDKVNAALAYPLASRFKGASTYGDLGGVPTTYVIDRKGVVRYAKSGGLDLPRFSAIVLPLLAEAD